MILRDRVVLVTGAAHRLGRAMALALAGDGAKIALHYGSSSAAAEATAREIEALGVEAWPVQADLSRPESIVALFDGLDERFGRLDLLVNSAASFRKQGWERIAVEDWDAALAVNLRAPFLCMQAAARRMRESRREEAAPALVVNLADLSGLQPWQGYVQHGVAKAGLLHLTRIAARELAPAIRVNAIVPGAILPPPGLDPSSERWREIGSASPLGAPGDPSRVVQTLRFLIANDYVTGAVIPVDGGEHLLGPVNH
ncbi:MAG: SDR family oxidoreductase [Caldilineae bacterium]|nr:SDR family oxidoreductase [Chloroflexota bacterium]MCB9176161.1 SDR family oxidoreductase [Caldilineae bacterium]